MAKYVGQGDQILLYHYQTEIDWDIFNNVFTNLFSAGVLKCDGCLQRDDDSHFTVKAGLSALIIPKNDLDELCKLETTTDFQLTITDPTTQQYLVIEYEHQPDPGHGANFLLLDAGSINSTYHVRVAKLEYDGSNNLIGFDTTNFQDKAYGVHSHDLQYYPKTESDGKYVFKAGDTLQGDLDFNGHKAINLPNPANPQDAATKSYVDAMASGGNHQHDVFEVDATIISNGYINTTQNMINNSEIVMLNGLVLTPGNLYDYEVTSSNQITFYCTLEVNDIIHVKYMY